MTRRYIWVESKHNKWLSPYLFNEELCHIIYWEDIFISNNGRYEGRNGYYRLYHSESSKTSCDNICWDTFKTDGRKRSPLDGGLSGYNTEAWPWMIVGSMFWECHACSLYVKYLLCRFLKRVGTTIK